MNRFGTLLRVYRRQCRDPLRGGMLTQERLGELLGTALGHAGYSGAAVSDWERNKSKIDEDDRPLLLSLLSVLVACHGMLTVQEANELLHAGNYRGLNPEEQRLLFPDLAPQSQPSNGRHEVASVEHTDERRKQLILLQKVQRFWVEGVLQNVLAAAPPLALRWEWAPGLVELPWENIVHPALYEQRDAHAVVEAFDNADRALLVAGEAGSGKTTTLLHLARVLGKRTLASAAEPVPVVLNLSSWAADRLPLIDWLTVELAAKYQLPRRIGRAWLEGDALALLLDGFDEAPDAARAGCARAINAFRLVIFPFFGGATVVKHYLVRLFLWRRGHTPLHYGQFLEHAARFAYLRRVGGGNTFMHHLLQQHFSRQYESSHGRHSEDVGRKI